MSTMTNVPVDVIFDRMLGLGRQADQALSGRAFGTANSARPQLWLPPVDTYETEQAFVIEADLPGVQQEHIDVHFEQGTLTIGGRRAPTLPEPRETGKMRVYSSERLSGAFSRSIRLPEYVDGEKIEATYANGVLTVRVPKLAAALPRKINVAVNAGGAKQIQG